tara:strand:- start:61423 stop:61665 length:243 start_codon:yes stop_codon:yes gene_type:complete
MKGFILTLFVSTSGANIQTVPIDIYPLESACHEIAEQLKPDYIKAIEKISKERSSNGYSRVVQVDHTCSEVSFNLPKGAG